MQSVIVWTVSLITVCAVGAIILYFSPSSSISKSVKTIVVLCVLLTFLSPLLKISFDNISISDEELIKKETDLSDDLSQQMMKYAVLEAEELCERFVIESGCKLKNIQAKANIDSENSIYISSIRLYMSEEYRDKESLINEKIKNVFYINGEFIWEKE